MRCSWKETKCTRNLFHHHHHHHLGVFSSFSEQHTKKRKKFYKIIAQYRSNGNVFQFERVLLLSLSAPPDLSHSHSALHIWVHIKIDFHRTCHLNIWNVSGNMKSTNQNKHSSDMCSVRCMDVVCASDAVSDPESYARFFNLCVWQSQNRLVSSGSATDDGEHTYVLLSSSSLSYKYFVWVKARQGEQQIYFADAEIHEWIVHPAEAQWESWSIWFSRFSTEYHRI